jgi:DMSO/TMAO reductase YedYZ heme-binding membrane subunit
MAGLTYRGLDQRTSLTRWGLAAVAVGIVAGSTMPGAIGGIAAVAAGNQASLPWLFERLFAFLAYLAITGSVVYGLLLSTKVLDHLAHRPVSFLLHKDLAAIGVGLAAVHGMLLGLDNTVPFSMAQILVPGLAPHQTLGVAFGQVALYLALIVTGSFYVRRLIGPRAWRTLHYLTFLAFLGATVHGVVAGSDSGSPWAHGMYVASGTAVVFLLAYRITLSIGQRLAGGRSSAGGHGRDRRPSAPIGS